MASSMMLSTVTRRLAKVIPSVLPNSECTHKCRTLFGVHISRTVGFMSVSCNREYSIFTNLTGDDLWKGATGVSSVGKKRGRARNNKRKENLNMGKPMGTGKKNLGYLGLNAPISLGQGLNDTKRHMEEPLQLDPIDLDSLPKQIIRRRRQRLAPMERGWTGRRLPGVNVGIPDPVGHYSFDGFKSVLLADKFVSTMTSVLKKKSQMFIIVAVGNGNGLAGYAIGKGPKVGPAIKMAKNKAGQRLQYIERYEDHTVFHNFYNKVGHTAVLVQRKEEGYGLKCHRAIKSVCELIGLKNLHVNVYGRINMNNLMCAFFEGLRNQETHQEIAERTKLHVVEYRPERGNMPTVIASPPEGEALKSVPDKETLDFDQMHYGGKRLLVRPKKQIFFYNNPAYHKKKHYLFKVRNQVQSRTDRKRCGLEKINWR